MDDFTEISDEVLDAVAGGYLYHDPGDATTHRKERFYILDSTGNIIMKTSDEERAKHWLNNLQLNQMELTATEFDRLRKKGTL